MDYNLLRNKIISHFKDLGDSYIPDGEWTDTQIANLKKKGYQGKFEYHDGKSLLVVKDKINFYHYKGPGYYSIKSNGMTVEIYESSYSEKIRQIHLKLNVLILVIIILLVNLKR